MQVGLARVVKDLGLEAADVITRRPAASPAGDGAGAGALPCLEIEVAPKGTVEPPGLLTSQSLGRCKPVDEERDSYQLLLNPRTLVRVSVPGERCGRWGGSGASCFATSQVVNSSLTAVWKFSVCA